jgi:cell division protein FtsI (penicillin-binding protein 3)
MLFALFLAFAALAARAVWVQGMSTQFLQKQGASRYERVLELPATRGKILDRNSLVLASSLPVKAVWAIPEDVKRVRPEKLAELARLLAMPQAALMKKLDSQRSFVYLKRQVEMDVIVQIEKLGIDGIGTRKEYKRYYPQGEVMAHMVGFTNVEDVGQEGIEFAQQKSLAGQTGTRRVIKDRLGRIVDDVGLSREPHDGKDITLSVDSKLQYIAYQSVKDAVIKYNAKAGAAVVLDVRTGEVLALANWPTYDPNDRSHLTGAQLRNRVITDSFEPGSTLKPFTVALALDKGLIKPNTLIDTGTGPYFTGGHPIRDTHPHGVIDVSTIIQKSSNIGTSKISELLSAQEMWEIFTNVGFGQAPRFGFPGAAAGRLRPYKSWPIVTKANMSFGQGISMSLLQLARAWLIFARDGDIIALSFQKVSEDPVGQQIISPKTAAQIRTMVESAVSPAGTAPQAQIAGYRVGGKTGTAQKVIDGRYSQTRYVGNFAGIVPMSNPRFVVAVMIDDPVSVGHTGGIVAAPIFATLAANALRAANVPPDASVTDIIIPEHSLEESN